MKNKVCEHLFQLCIFFRDGNTQGRGVEVLYPSCRCFAEIWCNAQKSFNETERYRVKNPDIALFVL